MCGPEVRTPRRDPTPGPYQGRSPYASKEAKKKREDERKREEDIVAFAELFKGFIIVFLLVLLPLSLISMLPLLPSAKAG